LYIKIYNTANSEKISGIDSNFNLFYMKILTKYYLGFYLLERYKFLARRDTLNFIRTNFSLKFLPRSRKPEANCQHTRQLCAMSMLMSDVVRVQGNCDIDYGDLALMIDDIHGCAWLRCQFSINTHL